MLNHLSQEEDDTIVHNDGTDLEPDFHEEEGTEPQRKTFPEPFVSVGGPPGQAKTHRESSRGLLLPAEPPRQPSSKRIIFVEPPAAPTRSQRFGLAEVLACAEDTQDFFGSVQPEALGMAAAYKKTLRPGQTAAQLPDLLGFLDDDLQTLDTSEAIQALELAFLELVRNSLSRDVYGYFMNHKHSFTDCLEAFAATGNGKGLLVSIKKKCQMLVFHGQAPASIAVSVNCSPHLVGAWS